MNEWFWVCLGDVGEWPYVVEVRVSVCLSIGGWRVGLSVVSLGRELFIHVRVRGFRFRTRV